VEIQAIRMKTNVGSMKEERGKTKEVRKIEMRETPYPPNAE